MSPARHSARLRTILAILAALAAGIAHAASGGAAPVRVPLVGLSERMLADGLSGLALFGYDPVAYFAEGAARAGRAEHELIWRGVVWRFASAANLEAFRREPGAYLPRCGGYDAEACARGLVVEADPAIFAIVGERLYVFRTQEARDRFVSDGALADKAEARWPGVEKQLVY
ncbi:YHS domain-containing (seleno)protein [Chelatococcus sp. SYSU_G07232]|uniref:YHS domain-containing (Seleno)protein n=1 Tax=Chelatococcus albus TaxID=3047466 RepID=A0ABT7AFJ0_9HYPH|nr:YHS domain-containing (seleno)protein [Chelatococcus sp. SYSU_G07232]MDJ1158144.1 YHS domain-containing (seleno)protein [Chelatococcus sp. SYSU_G07232]